MSQHAVVWLDHREARIFHVDAQNTDVTKVVAPGHHIFHTHSSKGAEGTKVHSPEMHAFFKEVAHALAGTESLLVVGPATAKLELIRFLHTHDAELERKVVAVETVDHPTDGQLAAYAKKYFGLDHNRS